MATPTKRRSFLARTLGSLAAISWLPFHAKAQDRSKGKFFHIVFFWFKNPDSEGKIKDFMKGTEAFFQKVDVIQTYHIGRPAKTPREVVDNSYTVSAVVTFNSKEDQDEYQAHQAHLDFIDDYSDLWERVKVYDSWTG